MWSMSESSGGICTEVSRILNDFFPFFLFAMEILNCNGKMFKLSRKDIKITKAAFRRKYYLMVIIFDLRYFYTTGAGEPGRGKLNKTRTRYKKGIRT